MQREFQDDSNVQALQRRIITTSLDCLRGKDPAFRLLLKQNPIMKMPVEANKIVSIYKESLQMIGKEYVRTYHVERKEKEVLRAIGRGDLEERVKSLLSQAGIQEEQGENVELFNECVQAIKQGLAGEEGDRTALQEQEKSLKAIKDVLTHFPEQREELVIAAFEDREAVLA